MQKYTRSSRSTTRGSSIESTEESAPDSHHLPLSSSTTNATRQTVVAIPEPIRRWHSFHSRRSSFGHSAAPHLPVVVTGSAGGGASAAPASASSTPPVTKPAARFLSPPPLTPRRRFSVWYTQTNNRTKQNKTKQSKKEKSVMCFCRSWFTDWLSINQIDSPCPTRPLYFFSI